MPSTTEETIEGDVEGQKLHGSCIGEFEVSFYGASVRGRRGSWQYFVRRKTSLAGNDSPLTIKLEFSP